MSDAVTPAPSTARLAAAFGAVYVIWGSTYLGIRIGLETMPPYVLASTRFIVAALLMAAYATWRGAPRPDRRDLASGVLTGLLMLTAGNGTVTWASQYAASGRIALVVATTPVWMALFEWWRPGGVRPAWLEAVGLVVGLGGVALLIGPDAFGGAHDARVIAGELLVLCGAMSWGAGSLLSRSARGRTTPAMRTALQMAVAGTAFTALATVRGEWTGFDAAAVSLRSWLAWGFLVTFGSMIGFTAYVWLLKVVSPAKAATYAYVNPAVALFLGWWLGGEPLSARVIGASAVIIGGVALVTIARQPAPAAAAADADAPEGEVA